jgi:hypothetical protein
VTEKDVERVVARDYPPQSFARVFAILRAYGAERWHTEKNRVRLAALKLAAGDLDRLRAHIETALKDFRDILAVAEYPSYFQSVSSSQELATDQRQQLIDADWKQYSSWLGREA